MGNLFIFLLAFVRGSGYGFVSFRGISEGEPCFALNGPLRPDSYHILTENRCETTLALCLTE